MKKVRVLMSLGEVAPEGLSGATVVVVDTILATTTLLTIFENGARRVLPVGSVEEASEVGASLEETPIYGGEQGAMNIEGYDCGPLPGEYPASLVSGRDVVFVTTNGTRALSSASNAGELLVGCLRNAPAVAEHLRRSDPDKLYIICAGSDGRFTLEDFLGASAIVSRIGVPEDSEGRAEFALNDGAWLALRMSERLGADPSQTLLESRAGSWFAQNDREETLRFVGDLGVSESVPAVEDGRLVLPKIHRDRQPAPGSG